MMDLLGILFRWLHIASGVMWIGLAYWFSFVNAPFSATMDRETGKKVVQELLPRVTYFFRWSALLSWTTGLLLLMLVFYYGEQMFPSQDQPWTMGSWVMVAATFLMFFLYDPLAKSPLGRDMRVFGVVSLVIVGIVAYAMYSLGGFGYRAYQVHLGAMFGTIMIMNGVMRIFPAQKKILSAMTAGTPPDRSLLAMIDQRARHNVYLTLPLIFTMINMHTTVIGEENWWAILVVMPVAWAFVSWVYGKSAAVKGV
jgi:uncharacterized membrane protein